MKNLIPLLILMAASPVFAASQGWSCKINGVEAVSVTPNPVPSEFGYIIRITDPTVCKTLDRICPYQAQAKTSYEGGYLAVDGEYASGVYFHPESGGMKLNDATINPENGALMISDQNWYFNPGQCTRN